MQGSWARVMWFLEALCAMAPSPVTSSPDTGASGPRKVCGQGSATVVSREGVRPQCKVAVDGGREKRGAARRGEARREVQDKAAWWQTYLMVATTVILVMESS